MRILFCTDFSKNSETALKYAISATEEYDAELTLLHVLEEVPSRAKTDDAIKTTKEQLEKLIPPEGRKTLKTKTAVRIGKAYQQIIQLALETQADMVAMGVRGRGALDLAVFGSTTYRLMQLGPCPVLAVHVWNGRFPAAEKLLRYQSCVSSRPALSLFPVRAIQRTHSILHRQ
jgi:nucleotide-binding universal stress UspA family protein